MKSEDNIQKISDLKQYFDILNQALIQILSQTYTTKFVEELEVMYEINEDVNECNWLTPEEKKDIFDYFYCKADVIKNKAKEFGVLGVVEKDIDRCFNQFKK